MNRKLAWILVFSLSLVVVAHGQTANNAAVVMGNGTPNYLPLWTSHNRIGNSVLFQANGDIGLGTTTPFAKLTVVSTDNFGIWAATSSTAPFATGVSGQSASPSGTGVIGVNSAANGYNEGVYGQSDSTNGSGVVGNATAPSGNTNGVWGFDASDTGNGVFGYASNPAATGNANGVYGLTNSTGFGTGVHGQANATTGTAFGVFGASNSPNGTGVFGYVSATSGYPVAVDAHFASPTGTAGRFYSSSGSGWLLQGFSGSNWTPEFSVDASGNGYFAGNLNVTGNLSKGSGSFKIDDPLDPANKTLSHSFVESPDMMNIYNGVAQLDAKGQAWVDLPQYFEALNRECRYQLTAIGAPGPNLYVAQEISGNRFKIEGGKAGAKVSWQVTGVRQDAYANAHRVPVEEDKAANERGYYLHPDAFGQPQSKGIEAANSKQPSTIDPAKLAAITNDGHRTAQ